MDIVIDDIETENYAVIIDQQSIFSLNIMYKQDNLSVTFY